MSEKNCFILKIKKKRKFTSKKMENRPKKRRKKGRKSNFNCFYFWKILKFSKNHPNERKLFYFENYKKIENRPKKSKIGEKSRKSAKKRSKIEFRG